MASSSFLLATLMLLSLSSTPTFAFSIQFQSPKTKPSLSGNGDTVQLNLQTPSSPRIIYPTKPFNLTSSTSFSSHFTFQLSTALALVIIPSDFPSKFFKNKSFEFVKANQFLGVEFYANVCSISYSRVRNVSKSVNFLKDGEVLSVWVDYRAILKRLDVRVTKLGDSKPAEPLISYRVDLGEILKGKEVLLGLVSAKDSGYVWSFETNDVPNWLHSIPVDPKEFSTVEVSKEKGSVFSGCVLVTGCGVLAALVMFFVWSYAVDRKKVEGEDFVRPVDFKYEKIGVLEGKDLEAAAAMK